jgi:hypothetical protein
LTTVQVPAGQAFFRTTSANFLTASASLHANVVNGAGALKVGGRYNYPGAVSVYLTETIETCLAERAFYFHREYLEQLDRLHIVNRGVALPPPCQKRFILWRVLFSAPIRPVADVRAASAGTWAVYPCLIQNPSQDYWHLKEARTRIQSSGAAGLRAPSSRCTRSGAMVVLFSSQSSNVASIDYLEVDFSLLEPKRAAAFTNPATQELDFQRVRVSVPGTTVVPPWARVLGNSLLDLTFHH